MPTQFCRNILIVRMGALGDILHALPAQQQLSHQLPKTSIHWLSETAYVPLLQTVPGISRIWTANTKKWRRQPFQPGEMVRLFRDLRRQHFDLALDFQGLLKSAVLARISGASRILGFAPERFKEKGIQWFYTNSQAGEGDLTRHIIETNLDLIRELVPVSKAHPVVPFLIPEADQTYVERKLRENEIANPVLINPGAGWVTKLWPARNYARLAREIQSQLGAPVVVTYGPGEEHLVERIQSELAPERLAAFPTSIVQLASLCQSSRLMIAGDSGPLHLAVAAGTPTVAILGPTSPGRNGPFNPADEVVKRDLPCSDSYKRVCSEFVCMDIPVERVLEAVKKRLAKPSRRREIP
jgi:lipopolysaccharide heptosyltransferase I